MFRGEVVSIRKFSWLVWVATDITERRMSVATDIRISKTAGQRPFLLESS
jgi:hypothetical protein